MIVLETTQNQYNEEIPVDAIRYDAGKRAWFRDQLNCWSCDALGLGTCQCVSHDPILTYQIPASEVQAILEKMDTPPVLTEEEEKALSLTVHDRAKEALSLAGLTLNELGMYAEIAYRIGVNPLPTIRKLFKDAGIPELRLEFAYYQSCLVWLSPDKGGPHLICYLDNSDSDNEQAWLEWNC